MAPPVLVSRIEDEHERRGKGKVADMGGAEADGRTINGELHRVTSPPIRRLC